MKLPIRHLSVRVPWHDNGWNGCICNKPRDNASCMFLPRIQNKDLKFEEKNHNKRFDEIEEESLPPCIDEKVAFLSSKDIIKNKPHPYSEFEDLYKHYKKTLLKYPGNSFHIIPYNWMLKDKETKENKKSEELRLNYDPTKEPPLSFQDQWVQHKDNQEVLLDTFASALIPDQSLIFIYAKNIPLIDRTDRILIGVTTVKSLGELTEYKYNVKNPPMRSVLWERPVYHGLKGKSKEGFILPYQELCEKLKDKTQDEIEEFIAFAPNFKEFSYGSELVSHDTAIAGLISLRNALINISNFLEEKNIYKNELEWLNNQISKIWDMRGAFPGLGSVLTAIKVPEGNIIAWEIEKFLYEKDGDNPKTDPWDIIIEIFKGKAKWLRDDLKKKIGTNFEGIWNTMPEIKKEYLKLLSRLSINNEQAEYFYKEKDINKYLENIYLFFENTITIPYPVSLDVVDKAVYQKEELSRQFPLPEKTKPNGVHDPRRIRAFIIDLLEKQSGKGHTFQTQEQIINLINEIDKIESLSVTIDILNYCETIFNEKIKIKIIDKDENNPEAFKYYKLFRYKEYKDIIFDCVNTRVNIAKRLTIKKDWAKIIEDEFGIIPEDIPQWQKEKEKIARKEKSATLNEISQSRFSVIIGPAGSGKTRLLNLFCKQSEILNTKILKLAPTGKARVKLGIDGQTIAQFLLKYNRYENRTGRYFINNNAERYSQARTIIIDEASMLTEDQLAAILDAVIDYDRLILVGDPQQLPPIGAGKPFVEIVNYLKPIYTEKNKPIISKGYAELTEIFRQNIDDKNNNEVETRIDVRLSKWFNNSLVRKEDEDIFDEIALNPNKDWGSLKFIEWYNSKDLQEKILVEIKKELSLNNIDDFITFDKSFGAVEFNNQTYYNLGSGKSAESWQILTPVNPNGFGTKELSRLIQKNFHSHTIELANNPPDLNLGYCTLNKVRRIPEPVSEDNLVYGDKVINLKNTWWDYTNNPDNLETMNYFANGEIGLIIGEFRSYKYLAAHFRTPKEKRKKLYPPSVCIEFSSQPGYAYKIFSSSFKEDGDIDFELAYAISVHKSQGSGFEKVFLILPSSCSILSRELLYTALTRQEKRIIIFHQGNFKDFKKYINDSFSETGRRLTDLFSMPILRLIKKRYYDSNYVQISAQGEFMISKSEVIIADQLFYQKVPYAYEQEITDDRGITIKPDFTIENREIGIVFYWEHLGMLTDDDYRKTWELKKEWYQYNKVVHYQKTEKNDEKILITTKDKPDHGIDAKEIKEIIEKVVKCK